MLCLYVTDSCHDKVSFVNSIYSTIGKQWKNGQVKINKHTNEQTYFFCSFRYMLDSNLCTGECGGRLFGLIKDTQLYIGTYMYAI